MEMITDLNWRLMVELIAFQNLWSPAQQLREHVPHAHTSTGDIVNKENAYLFHDDRNRGVAQSSLKLKSIFNIQVVLIFFTTRGPSILNYSGYMQVIFSARRTAATLCCYSHDCINTEFLIYRRVKPYSLELAL